MSLYRYKNIAGREIYLVGLGKVEKDQEFETRTPVENASVQLVKSEPTTGIVGKEAPQPNAVVEATPVNQPTQEEAK